MFSISSLDFCLLRVLPIPVSLNHFVLVVDAFLSIFLSCFSINIVSFGKSKVFPCCGWAGRYEMWLNLLMLNGIKHLVSRSSLTSLPLCPAYVSPYISLARLLKKIEIL